MVFSDQRQLLNNKTLGLGRNNTKCGRVKRVPFSIAKLVTLNLRYFVSLNIMSLHIVRFYLNAINFLFDLFCSRCLNLSIAVHACGSSLVLIILKHTIDILLTLLIKFWENRRIKREFSCLICFLPFINLPVITKFWNNMNILQTIRVRLQTLIPNNILTFLCRNPKNIYKHKRNLILFSFLWFLFLKL